MTRRDKREAAIRRNPKRVRFDDLDKVLTDNDFTRSQPSGGSSHYTYSHDDLPDILTIPMPHGRRNEVKRPYVKDAIRAIDTVQAIQDERDTAQKGVINE